jgi:uncharacterized protein
MTAWAGLALGAAFGALLQLSGASSHTKITNALRLKDWTIIKLILTAIGVGLLGVHLLDAFGAAHMLVKDLYLPGVVIAGAIFGVGFALTALAAAAEGKPDAWVTIAGGLFGTLAFAFLVPELERALFALGRFGGITLHGSLGVPGLAFALPLSLACLWLAVRLPRPGRNL